jgi:hypothetical protein
MSNTNGTITIIPAPEGYVVDFQNPQIQFVVRSYTVAAVEMTLAFLFLIQRLYTKLAIMKKFQLEDGTSLFKHHIQSRLLIASVSYRHLCMGILYGYSDMSTPGYGSWSYWAACLGD